MQYYSISAFREALNKLLKKPKDGYTSVVNDICNDFKEKTIDEIRNNRDMVFDDKTYRIVKLRLPNSLQKLSKSNGFRLIYYVNKKKDEVVFLYVYPKRGNLGLITISQERIISLLGDLIQESQDNKLTEMNSISGFQI